MSLFTSGSPGIATACDACGMPLPPALAKMGLCVPCGLGVGLKAPVTIKSPGYATSQASDR